MKVVIVVCGGGGASAVMILKGKLLVDGLCCWMVTFVTMYHYGFHNIVIMILIIRRGVGRGDANGRNEFGRRRRSRITIPMVTIPCCSW